VRVLMMTRLKKPDDPLCLREKAANSFVLASALVGPYPFPGREDIAASLMQAARGLITLAKLDPEQRALDLAESEVRRIMKAKETNK
jgi:hypothetical protein